MNAPPFRRLLRVLGYAAAFLLWLAVMSFPCFAFALATQGQLTWERGEYTSDRLWLVQERDDKGLGYQTERVVSDARPAGGPVCIRSTVRFWLWEGSAEGQNTEYCECYALDGSSLAQACP